MNIRNPLRRRPHPQLLEIPARTWLRELSRREGRPLTLAGVPDEALEAIRAQGFDAIWLMGVWRTSPAARQLALTHPALLREYESLLPDWQIDDVGGSPYSIEHYEASPLIGGEAELDFFRLKLEKRGLGLILDFVGNHLGRDHRWLDEHPDRLIQGTVRDLGRAPSNWFVHFGAGGERIFAHGRDPYFDGWSDTVQVDLRRRAAREAHLATLRGLAQRCDGVRCDVAMLLLNDVFRSTWGALPDESGSEFWEEAIGTVRREHPEFVFIAETYWGLESKLIELGFDFSYDKSILDALAGGDLPALRRQHLLPFEERRARLHFLENHDEMRALARFGKAKLPAALVFSATLPGLRFFQHGQSEGWRVRTPVQLARAPEEPDDPWCRQLHERLFEILKQDALHSGEWSPWTPSPARSDSGLFGNRWRLADVEWIALVNLGSASERASLQPQFSEQFEARAVFSSREAPVVLARQGNSISVTLEPGEATCLQVSAQPVPLPRASSPS